MPTSEAATRPILRLPATIRQILSNGLFLCISAFSLLVALALRFDGDTTQFLNVQRYFIPVLILLFCRQVAVTRWNLNALAWRFIGSQDLVVLTKAHAASSLGFAASIYALSWDGFPRSALAMEFMLSLLFNAGFRFAFRIFHERRAWQSGRSFALLSHVQDVVVLGAGQSGNLILKTIQSQPRLGYRPVACFDDSERMTGMMLHSVPVVGPIDGLNSFLISHQKVKAVIVAIPSLSNARFSEIRDICLSQGVLLKRLQAFDEIACLDAAAHEPSLSIESLLEKEVIFEHAAEVKSKVAGTTVLVSGAGGSIGSEICRQLGSLGIKRLVLVERNEFNLYKIDGELRQNFSSLQIDSCIADICDVARMSQIISDIRPEYLFHAAAHKHVPLMEANVKEAFKNNVIGTQHLLDISARLGVKRFVLISTDKAVEPSNVMGASKRLAELLAKGSSVGQNSPMQIAVVRFGNVINSSGSVIPLFKEQIARGGPITVTHPEVERFFMSIPEAVKLVLTAGILASGGEILVLDMGEKLKIVDVARRMLSLYGRRDIPIVFTGLRKGEKLTELLTSDYEKIESTRFSRVFRVVGANVDPGAFAKFQSEIDQLEQALPSLGDRSFADQLKLLARYFDSPISVTSAK